MRIRSGRPADAAAIADLWFDSWMSTHPEHPNVTRGDLFERAVKELAERWEATVAEDDNGLLGFLALVPREQRLDQLFIVPSAQRRGIGTQLLNLAKQRLIDGFWFTADAGNERAVATSAYKSKQTSEGA